MLDIFWIKLYATSRRFSVYSFSMFLNLRKPISSKKLFSSILFVILKILERTASLSSLNISSFFAKSGSFSSKSTFIHWVDRKNYDLVAIVCIHHESIIEQEPWIALFAIGIEQLFANTDILETLDEESLFLFRVVPHSLLWNFMV